MEDIKKAIAVLKYHQEWRKGAEIPQTDVKKLTNALDTAIEILSKWEESTRWRKVEEELPEKKDKGYFILVRSGDIMDAYYVYPDTNYACLRDWEEWKPIH